MDKQIVVLCGHRSGSSVVAGILHQLGVNMGTDLMPPSEHNPRGYFEDMDFVRLNAAILKPWGWFSLPDVLERKPLFDNKIKRIVQSREGVWGWKDPRTALTLPLYWEYLTNPYLVVVDRPHLSCAKSLNARDGIPTGLALEFTNRYYRRIYDLVQRYYCPSIIVRYDHLLRDDGIINRLAQFLGLDGKVEEGFVDKELCHF